MGSRGATPDVKGSPDSRLADMLDIRCCYIFGGSSCLSLLPPLPIIEHVDDTDMVTIHAGVVLSQQ